MRLLLSDDPPALLGTVPDVMESIPRSSVTIIPIGDHARGFTPSERSALLFAGPLFTANRRTRLGPAQDLLCLQDKPRGLKIHLLK
jgi:hypothetical protein